MDKQKLLGVVIKNQSKEYILEKIQKFIHRPYSFFHIVSLNPENLTIAKTDPEFQKILSEGDIQLVDGIGVALGCDILHIRHGGRLTGTDFMETILEAIDQKGFRTLLLGGVENLANELAVCYQVKYPNMSFEGRIGFVDIKNPKEAETRMLLALIVDYKPQIIFSAFGSPWQEKFFYRFKHELSGIVCMGVGGGFDFAAGKIHRAPVLMRQTGLEWLYRLIIQPWRFRRQRRLLDFILAIIKQKLTGLGSH